MSGKFVGLSLLVAGLIAGAAMYYLQVYAYYDRVALAAEGGTVTLRLTDADGSARAVPIANFKGIDSDSSPIRFRACFDLSAQVFENAQDYSNALPLNAPGWFDCFDAAAIGADLETGAARAFLGEANVIYGIDRVIAAYPDGRAFAWHQINECGKEVFDGNAPPAGCPLPPQDQN
jgi:hypothetical protein